MLKMYKFWNLGILFCALSAGAQQTIPPFTTAYGNFTTGIKLSGSYGTNGQCPVSNGSGATWGACGGGSVPSGLQYQMAYYPVNGSTLGGAAHVLTNGTRLALGLAGAFGCAYDAVLCESETSTTNLGVSSFNFSNTWNPATNIRANGYFANGNNNLDVNLDGQSSTDTIVTAAGIGVTSHGNTTQVGSLNALQLSWQNAGNAPLGGSGAVSFNAQNFGTGLNAEFLGFSGAYQQVGNGTTDHVATFEDEGIHTSNSGIVSTFQAFHSYFGAVLGTSHVGNMVGILIDSPIKASTALIDSAAGLWVNPQAKATNNYTLYSQGPQQSVHGGPFTAGDFTAHALGLTTAPTGTPSTSGGTILNGTYYFVIVPLDFAGLTGLPSAESSAITTTGANTSSVALQWNANDPDSGAGTNVYRVWMGTSPGGENRYFAVTADAAGCTNALTIPVCNFTLTLPYSSGTSGTLPTVNQTGKLEVNHAFIDSLTPTSPNIICANGTSSELTNGNCSVGSAGSCGDASHSCSLTFNAEGRETARSNVAINTGFTTGSNGNGTWVQDPTGTITERGSITVTNGAGTVATGTITFPLTFPTSLDSLVVSGGGYANGSSQDAETFYSAAQSTSGATAIMRCSVNIGGSGCANISNTVTIYWIAIGK